MVRVPWRRTPSTTIAGTVARGNPIRRTTTLWIPATRSNRRCSTPLRSSISSAAAVG